MKLITSTNFFGPQARLFEQVDAFQRHIQLFLHILNAQFALLPREIYYYVNYHFIFVNFLFLKNENNTAFWSLSLHDIPMM